MTEDIMHRIRQSSYNRNLDFLPETYNEVLIMIKNLCLTIANKSLAQLEMVSPNRLMQDLF